MSTTVPAKVRRSNGNGKVETPIRPANVQILDSKDAGFIKRLLIGTPTRGTVRIEWYAAMRSLMVPPNFSSVQTNTILDHFIPLRWTVAHGQNLIVREAVAHGFEWLLFIEDDTIPPIDLLCKLEAYMKDGPPVVSGLYYQKGFPCEPVMYRGRGVGAFTDFKLGKKVWVDGVPTGCLLIHVPLLAAMWADAPEYVASGEKTRAVFEAPTKAFIRPDGNVNATVGTSDLDWCTRVIEGDYLKKSGWGRIQRKTYPFLVDTSIVCTHIAPDGTRFGPGGVNA